MLQSLSEPDLDDRLPCHTKTGSLTIELLDHPKGEIHIDALLLQAGHAQAVDYVKCDATQKAYERVFQQQRQAGTDAYRAMLEQLCPYPSGSVTDGGKAIADSYACNNKSENYQAARAASSKAEANY